MQCRHERIRKTHKDDEKNESAAEQLKRRESAQEACLRGTADVDFLRFLGGSGSLRSHACFPAKASAAVLVLSAGFLILLEATCAAAACSSSSSLRFLPPFAGGTSAALLTLLALLSPLSGFILTSSASASASAAFFDLSNLAAFFTGLRLGFDSSSEPSLSESFESPALRLPDACVLRSRSVQKARRSLTVPLCVAAGVDRCLAAHMQALTRVFIHHSAASEPAVDSDQ